MSRSPRAWRWALGSLPLLLVFAPPIWSQFVERAEFQRFHQDALREIVRKNNLDPAAMERIRKALQPGGLDTNQLWDKNRAAVSLTEELKRGDLSLKRDRSLFEVRPKPRPDDPPGQSARTSLDFVDSLSSVIRRLSILDQLGRGASSPIQKGRLQAYLRDTMKVADFDQVAKSFDTRLTVDVKKLEQPMTLWRIYGGGSGPVGRYYFCCLRPGVSDDAEHSLDASRLATPPGNLRQHLAGVTVPAGTTVLVGTVADNFADKLGRQEKGGNTQIFIPYVAGFPFDEYRRIAESQILRLPQLKKAKSDEFSLLRRIEILRSEIIVQSDDRILRFRGPDTLR